MAKIIKRAGIVFFVLVISFLLIFGCLVATGTISSDKNTDLQNIDSNTETTADKSYTLSGTCAQKATTWNTAVAYSKNNSGVNVNITLGSDWIATSDSTYTTSFGTGDGFDSGRICIPSGVTITLDLNGYALNRNLTTEIVAGGVIYVNGGHFSLLDNFYVQDRPTEWDSAYKISQARIGKITGSKSSDENAAALYCTNGAKCDIYGGIFYNNVIKCDFYCASAIRTTKFATTTIYRALIAFNKAYLNQSTYYKFGAVITDDNGTTELHEAIIRDNYGSRNYGYLDRNSYTKIGAGFQCYNNYYNESEMSEYNLYSYNSISIIEPLDKDGKITRIGISDYDYEQGKILTNNYARYNVSNPLKYFFISYSKNYTITLKSGEVIIEKKLISEKYEYTYYEDGYRKNYSDNNVIHGKNDYNLLENCGMTNAILGNILPNTSINSFISNINFAGTKIILYDNKGNIVYNKGTASSGIDTNNGVEKAVGTGWKLETYSDSNVKIETVYLSVLGDINGDGRISASDIALLRQLANDKTLFANLSTIEKLACLIDNRGALTIVDGEILRLVIQNITNINMYF